MRREKTILTLYPRLAKACQFAYLFSPLQCASDKERGHLWPLWTSATVGWMDRRYVSSEDTENSEQIVAMEEEGGHRAARQRRCGLRSSPMPLRPTMAGASGAHWLSSFILAAEQGSEAAAANAAWMLRRQRHGPTGAGAGFREEPATRLELAARLYERAAAQGRCAACAVELGNLVHDAEALGLSRPRNLTEVSCCPSRVLTLHDARPPSDPTRTL